MSVILTAMQTSLTEALGPDTANYELIGSDEAVNEALANLFEIGEEVIEALAEIELPPTPEMLSAGLRGDFDGFSAALEGVLSNAFAFFDQNPFDPNATPAPAQAMEPDPQFQQGLAQDDSGGPASPGAPVA